MCAGTLLCHFAQYSIVQAQQFSSTGENVDDGSKTGDSISVQMPLLGGAAAIFILLAACVGYFVCYKRLSSRRDYEEMSLEF
jgi:hypothetical protein